MIGISAKNVVQVSRTATFGLQHTSSTGFPLNMSKIDTYSGRIKVQFDAAGGAVTRQSYVSFVPIDDQKNILFYPLRTKIRATLLVALSSTADDDDQANVAAVDSARVSLTPKVFPGVGDPQECLLLYFDLAALNAAVHFVGYHIYVVHDIRENEPITEVLHDLRNETPEDYSS